MNSQNMNIHMKVIELRKAIEKVPAEGKGHRNTKFIKTEDILRQIKDKMNELYILLQPEMGDLTRENVIFEAWDKDAKKDVKKNKWDVSGPMRYVWVNAENPEDRIEVDWFLFGQGDDSSKAFGSGLSYSERYFLVKYFNLTEDTDSTTNENNNYSNQSNNYSSNENNNSRSYDYYDAPPHYQSEQKKEKSGSSNNSNEPSFNDVKAAYGEYTQGDLSNFDDWYNKQKKKGRNYHEMCQVLSGLSMNRDNKQLQGV